MSRPPRPFARGVRLAAALLALAGSVAGCDCGPATRAARAQIRVSPEAIDFGKVAVGEAGEQLVEVHNDGTGSLLVASVALGAPSDELNVTHVFTTDCQGAARTGSDADLLTIVPGGCARFEARFVPKLQHALEGQKVVVTSNDLDHPTLEIPIAGQSVVPTIKVCVVEPDGTTVKEENCAKPTAAPPVLPAIDFGPVPLTDKALRKVRVSNLGDGPLQLLNAHVESEEPDFSMVPGPFTGKVEASKSQDLDVKFEPEGDGPMTATLVIPSNDPTSPEIKLPMTAEAKGPRLCILPPEGLDFGAIPVGTSRKLSLTLNNCGAVNYNITQLDFVEDDLSVVDYAVAQGAVPARPIAFPPGKQLVIDVTYTPHTVAAAGAAGDTARFLIKTDFQTGAVPVKGKGATPACDGQQPTADIKVTYNGNTINPATTNVEPLEQVGLDGSGSTVPRGGAQYQWRLVSQPPNGTVGISGAGARPKLYLELAGDYVVELVVKDQYGCASAPKQVTVHSVPKGKLHLQLTWPESYGDVDLHYVGPGGAFYQAPGLFSSGPAGDAFYANKKPDWGRNNTVNPDGKTTNDPSLDIDKLWGNGPENVTHDLPFDGTYKVIVHYFCSHQYRSGSYSSVSSGAINANLKVFVNGVKQAEVNKALHQRDVWEVGSVVVSGGGTQITFTASTAAPTRSYWGGANDPDSQSCTGDTN